MLNFDPIIQRMEAEGLSAYQYELEGHHHFRDILVITKNHRARFERFCYGEAASHVCTMWANALGPEGKIEWNYASCDYSGKTDAPLQLTKMEGDSLYFDGKEKTRWVITQKHRRFKDGTGGFWGRRRT